MGKKAQSVLVPEAPTMDGIVKQLGKGRFTVGHDGSFGPLLPGAFTGARGGAELNHRRWNSPARVVGEQATVNVISASEMEGRLVPQFLQDALEVDLMRPAAEMITTSQGAMDLLEKVRIDIDIGLADVPLLYQPLYERVNGPFPGGAVQIDGDVLFDANVVFLQKFEAGEIIFGTLAKSGAPTFVPISTYAAGFEWTEDMIEFDRSYEIGMNARAFGRAYNYLLNHLHLSPIIAFSYAGGNTTAFDATAGASTIEKRSARSRRRTGTVHWLPRSVSLL